MGLFLSDSQLTDALFSFTHFVGNPISDSISPFLTIQLEILKVGHFQHSSDTDTVKVVSKWTSGAG